jgi:ABC-2 type transport system ATP-binding protein
MSAETICECRNLSKSFGSVRVLENCSMIINKRELIGLVGENGSGKTTFIRCLLGYIQPDSGFINIEGSIGYCPQENIMNQVYTVSEHLSFIRDIYGQHCSMDDDYIEHLIEVFNLRKYLNHLIGNLSGGTRQKVQFITSILHKPSILLLDEPYEGFDWAMYLAFWKIVDDLCSHGTAILLITHFVYDHERFNRLYNLENGVLHEQN